MSDERETGLTLDPRYDRDGLITAVASDAATGELLMLAHMNAEALAATIATGLAHFWSRSRRKLWRKGEESGNELRVVEMRVDCDQDALVLREALGRLPARQRAVVVLRYQEDLSEAEVARLLRLPVGTVKSTASRALARLREELGGVTGELAQRHGEERR